MGADVVIPATTNTIFRTYPDGATAAPYGSYVVDLTQTEEALWNKVHSKHRNVIRNAPLGIAVSVVEGTGSAVISDNLISGAGRGAVVAMRWSDPASGDLARSGADDFPNLMVERNRVS